MNNSTIVLISILLLALPVIPAYLLNFPAFVATSTVGLIITLALMFTYKTFLSNSPFKSKIVGLYFSGVFTVGLALGIFFALPVKPRLFAIVGLVYALPFFYQFIITIKPYIRNIVSLDFLRFGNGYVAFLLVLIIGAIIGRFLTNFYELLVLYIGTVIVGILTLLYFRK